MWRTPPDFEFTYAMVVQPETPRAETPRRTRGTRWSERRRTRVVGGLRRVARRSRVSPRAQRSEVLLCDRAEAIRTELLELAAVLQATSDPPPEVIAALHELLTDGCGSPLYNADVPSGQLSARLERARVAVLQCEPQVPSLAERLPTDPSAG